MTDHSVQCPPGVRQKISRYRFEINSATPQNVRDVDEITSKPNVYPTSDLSRIGYLKERLVQVTFSDYSTVDSIALNAAYYRLLRRSLDDRSAKIALPKITNDTTELDLITFMGGEEDPSGMQHIKDLSDAEIEAGIEMARLCPVLSKKIEQDMLQDGGSGLGQFPMGGCMTHLTALEILKKRHSTPLPQRRVQPIPSRSSSSSSASSSSSSSSSSSDKVTIHVAKPPLNPHGNSHPIKDLMDDQEELDRLLSKVEAQMDAAKKSQEGSCCIIL